MSGRVTTVTDALDALGATKGEVVDNLLRLGVEGWPGSSRRCPVAQYLNSLFPYSQFDVTSIDINDAEGVQPVVGTPFPIMEFITAFDSGAAPELYAAGAV